MNPPVELRFRCPGEPYWIDHSTHLARLATGYLPCRSCSSRFQTDGLVHLAPKIQGTDQAPFYRNQPAVEAHTAGLAKTPSPTIWTSEGLAGTAENQINARTSQRFGMALGTALAGELGAGSPPRVAVGGDGRWLSAPLVAAVSRGCQLAGCRVVELGGATAGSLALVIEQQGLDGGILVGNALSAPETVSLTCWGPQGRPWSAGGGLELVRAAMTSEAVRSSRRYGGLERFDPTDAYRQRLAELFHSLRPLRWVLDTASRPLMDHLRVLLGRSACEIISPGVPAAESETGSKGNDTAGNAKRRNDVPQPAQRSPSARRIDRLRAQIVAAKADFGLWIDGDGDALILVDDQGRRIGPEQLLWGIWRQAGTIRQAVVLSSDCARSKVALESAGARVIEVEPTREAVDRALRTTGAMAAAGPGDRLWLAGQTMTSDALAVVGWLLQWLSGQDRPLSEMLD